jgi:hypothetical protein
VLSATPGSATSSPLSGLQLPAAAKAGPAGLEATALLPPLLPGVAASLALDRATERQLVLAAEAVVHVRAESGSCALRDEAGAVLAQDGLDGGCRIDRALGPGRYRVSARPAAGLGPPGLLTLSEEPLLEGKEGVGDERAIGPGEARLFRFALASEGELGLGLQASADRLSCEIQDEAQRTLGTGCQQFLRLTKGRYLLRVSAPADAQPLRFRPVLLGLLGGERGIPDDVLRELVSRLGGEP